MIQFGAVTAVKYVINQKALTTEGEVPSGASEALLTHLKAPDLQLDPKLGTISSDNEGKPKVVLVGHSGWLSGLMSLFTNGDFVHWQNSKIYTNQKNLADEVQNKLRNREGLLTVHISEDNDVFTVTHTEYDGPEQKNRT